MVPRAAPSTSARISPSVSAPPSRLRAMSGGTASGARTVFMARSSRDDQLEEAVAVMEGRNAERLGDGLSEIAERGAGLERHRTNAGAEGQQWDALARVIGPGCRGIVAVIGGD